MNKNMVSGCLTVLADNAVYGKNESLGEHGFSVYVETGNGNILFDTGRGKTIVHNSFVFKKDLAGINKIVLSHSHGDHTGGLPEVLRLVGKKPVDVYAHPDIFLHRFRKKKEREIYSGIPYVKGYLEMKGAHFIFNKDYARIEDGVYLTGEVPRKTNFEGGDLGGRFAVRQGELIPDIIPDDQSMVLHTQNGLLIILGCAHAGIVNIVNHIIEKTGNDHIYGIIGGTHIGFSGELQLRESIAALKSHKIRHFIPSHCTGLAAIAELRNEFISSFHFSHVGFNLNF